MLSDNGQALVMGPRRKGSLDQFVDYIQQTSVDMGLVVEVCERYDDRIWEQHERRLNEESYSTDEYYPILLKISKLRN
jgi:hypothetical protein